MSDISNCDSYSSFLLNVLASEVGFLGVNPSHPEKMYDDYLTYRNRYFSEFTSNPPKNDATDTLNIYYPDGDGYTHKDLLINKTNDIRHALDLDQKNKLTLKMTGIAVTDHADPFIVSMLFENMLLSIGNALNKDDAYFNILLELWNSLGKDSKYFETMSRHKKMDLKLKFKLSQERLDLLE